MSVPGALTFRENSRFSCWPSFCICFGLFDLLGSGHQAVAVENLALRLQLAGYKRKRRRPVLTQWDRLFWVGLSQVWSDWRHALIFVQPDTVVRWQREWFRRFWARVRDQVLLKKGSQSTNHPTPSERLIIAKMANGALMTYFPGSSCICGPDLGN